MEGTLSTEAYTCPRCGTAATKGAFAESNYTCRRCFQEVAYLDFGPTGSVRAVLGWLLAIGTIMHDRYRITGILGKGGFGAAYLVQDTRVNNRARALKEVPASHYDEHETELLSRLDHPAVPDITDRFEDGGMKYLVIEFGGNRTLESERRASSGGVVPIETLLPWMRELCDVLTYLHKQNPPIVHRDLKPENILLNEQGRIMLIDFGIAKQIQAFGPTRVLARSASHGFSPPEQVLGTGTDARSDVYALGATMYALLTGKIPTPAHERLGGAQLVAPDKENPAIPRALAAAITKALELNSEARQKSVAEIKALLDSDLWIPPFPPLGPDPIGRPTVPVGPGLPNPWPQPDPDLPKPRSLVVPVAAALGVLAIVVVVLWPREERKPDDPPAPVPNGAVEPTVAPNPYNARTAMAEALARQQNATAIVVEQPTEPPVAAPAVPTQAAVVAQPPPPAPPRQPPPTRIVRPRPTNPPAVVAAPTPEIKIFRRESQRLD